MLVHDVPVADAIIAFIAKSLKAIVVSDDPHFSKLKSKQYGIKSMVDYLPISSFEKR